MTKSKKLWRKRSFRGNQFSKSKRVVGLDCVAHTSDNPRPSTSDSDRVSADANCSKLDSEVGLVSNPISVSKRKLAETVLDDSEGDSNVIVSINLLSSAIMQCCVCKNCKNSETLYVEENVSLRKGLACNLVIYCNFCGSKFRGVRENGYKSWEKLH
uniref:Uncharacterized protein n=1 Tax=Homalodisca liturata TaxID=320908 RepID=A0A1B6I0J8_9HEMI